MTNISHTPAPWQRQSPEPDGEILITDEQEVTIATCWRNPLDPPEWVEANSRIIVALPDLIYAL